jgi:thioredoxin reductase (NADPH)
MPELYDTLIIGGGVSGFSAAMYAGRLKLKTLVIAAIRGGTIILTNDIGNWPGIKQIDGTTLAKQIEEHALSYESVKAMDDKVVKVEKSGENYSVSTEGGKRFDAKTLIFATGTEWKKLGVPGEEEYSGKGVHYCALCDGYFYKGKTIAVVGGADSAAKEAILLTQWADKVYMIYRREKIRPEPVNMVRVEEKIKEGKMEIINNTNVTEIKGGERVTHAILDKEYKGSKELKLDGLFIDIGHVPQSQLAQQLGVELDKGYIKITRNAETNVPGVFAAGDVTDTKFKQALTGSAEGVHAAYSAYEYLKDKD